ncbi:MAG: hypothetical protein AAGJ35_03580 [Myxococcota bacterium]
MRKIRWFLAFLLVIGIAMPMTSSTIWLTGSMHAVLQPDYVRGLSQDVVKRIPGFVQQVFQIAQTGDAVKDPEAQAWLAAMRKVEPQPSVLFEKIGMAQWLEGQLSVTLGDFSKMLSGDTEPKDIILNNKLLKQALTHSMLTTYVVKVFEQLPACSEVQKYKWQRFSTRQAHHSDDILPACNPGPLVVGAILPMIHREASKIPDQQVVMLARDFPFALQLVRIANKAMWLLFLFPGLLLLLFAWIGSAHSKSFLRWVGLPVLLTSIVPLTISWFFKDFYLLFFNLDSMRLRQLMPDAFATWTPELHQTFLNTVTPILQSAIAPLMQSVFNVSLVCVTVGGGVFLLSFLATGKERRVLRISSKKVLVIS